MKNRKWRNRFIITGCLFVLIALLWFHASYRSPEMEEWLAHTKQYFDSIPNATDSMLFRVEMIPFDLDLPALLLQTSDLRNDKRLLILPGTGSINYTSIDLTEDLPLDSVLFIRNEETLPAKDPHIMSYVYTRLRQGPPTDSIICSYTTDGVFREMCHSENFRCYNFYAQTFSIRYGENESSDISMTRNWENKDLPTSIAFLKKGKKVYFIAYGYNLDEIGLERALSDDYLCRIVKWQEE